MNNTEFNYEYNKDIDGSMKKIPQYREYRKGDRVIHLDNMSMKNRFIISRLCDIVKIDNIFQGGKKMDLNKISNFIKGLVA